jgi:hypothetical protein
MPDFGEVPQRDPGGHVPGLPPVVAIPARQRPDLDQYLPLPGGEPPRPVPAGLANGGKGEPGSAWRVRPVWLRRLAGRAHPSR